MSPASIRNVTIAADLDGEMRRHVEADYPSEGCGIMIGSIDDSTAKLARIVKAENANSERGRDRFEIDPLLYYKTEQALAPGERVLGFFHSHPDCPAVASETDRQFAMYWPGFIWVIYRVDEGQATGLRSWIVDEGTQHFVEMNVTVTP